MADDIAARYVGTGDFLLGVPARDLTVDEWAALGAEQQALIVDLGLYVAVTPAE